MESSATDQPATVHHKKLHTKRTIGKHHPLDSPAYDASEEDNDPISDDASSASVPAHAHAPRPHSAAAPTGNGRDPARQSTIKPAARQRHHLAASLVSDDDGVDSPTYDGDIESSTAGVDGNMSAVSSSTLGHRPHLDSVSTLSAPVSADSLSAGNQPPTVAEEPPVVGSAEEFNPSSLTEEDIQAFVRKAIEGESFRKYKINPPPTDRPVRIYADGVYDLFHFGHALQLRQAKLCFPNVHLLVGVCSDELVRRHKAKCVMTHAERCEAARHCRWVDEVVPGAPWIIDAAFVARWRIDYVAHDEDPYAAGGLEDVYAYVKAQGKFLPTRRTPGVSTSELLERIVKGYRMRDFDPKLAKMGHPELMAEGSDYEGVESRAGSPSRGGAAGQEGGGGGAIGKEGGGL